MNFLKCNICFKQSEKLVHIDEIDNTNISLLTKIKYVVPELEWFNNYYVCEICKLEIETSYIFKLSCIHTAYKRQCDSDNDECNQTYEDDNNEEKLVTDLSEISFSCAHCEDTFMVKESLVKHIETNHSNVIEKKFACSKCHKTYKVEKVKNKHELKCNSDIQQHQCNQCLKYLTSKKLLQNHKKQCTSQNNSSDVLHCKSCSLVFDTEELLKRHLQEKHSTEYFCIACLKQFIKESDLDYHMDNEHAIIDKNGKKRQFSIFICEMCQKVFKQKKMLLEHCTEEHSMNINDIKPYSCYKCPKRFKTCTNLIQHKKYHLGIRSHVCSFCGKSYVTHSDLATHEFIHLNKRNFQCEICNSAFNTSKSLKAHIFVVHTDTSLWKFQCQICSKRFPLKVGFDEHVKRHAGVKDFACHICGKAFVSRSELVKHTRFHSNVKAYKCKHCPKEYKNLTLHRIHLTKAHGIGNANIPIRVKKYICHICPSAFYDKKKLSRHLCSHFGLKPFECTICERKFSDKSYLMCHIRNQHENKKLN